MTDTERLTLRVENELESMLDGGTLDEVAANPLRFLGRIAKGAAAVKNSITNSLGISGQMLEDIIVAKALAIFDEWAKGNNPDMADWYEESLEAAARKLLEASIRAAL